jgi:hypothetical protein
MKMSEWAKREVEIACKKENPNWDGKSFDYGCACYQSALKAYNSLCEDEHSGMSFALTKNILIRLMNGNPLTPITDNDFFIGNENMPKESEEYLKEMGLKSDLQCPRKSSLFRKETLDGKVSYTDVDRVVVIDKNGNAWFNGKANEIVNTMFPIVMPYTPSDEKYKIYSDDFLLDKNNGDYDHIAYMYVVTPAGEKIELNEYYKEIEGKLFKISKEEYFKDKENKND